MEKAYYLTCYLILRTDSNNDTAASAATTDVNDKKC